MSPIFFLSRWSIIKQQLYLKLTFIGRVIVRGGHCPPQYFYERMID